MISLETPLGFAERGVPAFPCCSRGRNRKHPLTPHGFRDATTDPDTLAAWWRRWPGALIGIPTGDASGYVVLDIDVKRPEANGFDTLDALGFAILPETPMVHTATGGLHLYFEPPDHIEIRNTEGAEGRGIGAGLDWRGEGGYVIVPSPGSGYEWDPIYGLDTFELARVPSELLPREPIRTSIARPSRPTIGLSPYAEAALDSACRRIVIAPAGGQERTLNAECFCIGKLAGAGVIPSDFAYRALIWSARQMPDHDPRRPWRDHEIEAKVNRAFTDGTRQPREARRA